MRTWTKTAGLLLPALLVICAGLVIAAPAWCEVEWDVRATVATKVAPLDVAAALNGKWIYVLTETGTVQIYDIEGKLSDTIDVGPGFDRIGVGPHEDRLYLSSRTNGNFQIVDLSVIYQIDTAGSPFKGPEAAPVVIAVFTDFE
jgi:hypothetical protein